MKTLCIRTKMACGHKPNGKRHAYGGCCYSYDVYVPEADLPEHFLAEEKRQAYSHRTNLEVNGKRSNYVEYAQAVRPASLCDMPQGYSKLAASEEHEKTARIAALDIARQVFPELSDCEKLPLLWLVFTPPINAESAKVWRTA